VQRSLEEAASAHATAAAVEQKRREAASDAAAAARDQRVMQEAAAEVRPVMTTQPLLRQEFVDERWVRGGRKTCTDEVCSGLSDERRTVIRGNS